MWVGGLRHAPAALTPGNTTSIHCTGGWLGSRGGMDGVRKITPIVGFDLRTVQLSQSRYQLRYPSPRIPTVRSSKRVSIIGHKVTSCTLQACIPPHQTART